MNASRSRAGTFAIRQASGSLWCAKKIGRSASVTSRRVTGPVIRAEDIGVPISWRSGRISVTRLASRAPAFHHRRMDETWVTLGVMCMGLGGVVAGLVGVVLPEGRRLGALFALIAGAGVGLVVIGLGALLNERNEPTELTVFLASLLGLLTVCGASWAVWRRAAGSRPSTGELA
jgi:hypothetical protein